MACERFRQPIRAIAEAVRWAEEIMKSRSATQTPLSRGNLFDQLVKPWR